MIAHWLPNSQLNQRQCNKLLLCFLLLQIWGLFCSITHFSLEAQVYFVADSPLSFAPALPYGGREMWFMVECVVQHVRTWSDTQHIKCLKVKYYHENLERSFKSCHPNSKRNDLYLSRRGTSEPKNHRCLEPDVDVSHSFHDTAK